MAALLFQLRVNTQGAGLLNRPLTPIVTTLAHNRALDKTQIDAAPKIEEYLYGDSKISSSQSRGLA